MPQHTWTNLTPGYSELSIEDRVRGYVEHRTRLAFWNYGGQQRRAFVAITPRGTYPTIEAAQDALEKYVDAKDAVCDGRRGVPGSHSGCGPALCTPRRKAPRADAAEDFNPHEYD